MSGRKDALAIALELVADDIRRSESRLALLSNQLADAQEHCIVVRLTKAIYEQRHELERHKGDYAEIAKRIAAS